MHLTWECAPRRVFVGIEGDGWIILESSGLAGIAGVAGVAQKKCKGFILYGLLNFMSTQSLTNWYC